MREYSKISAQFWINEQGRQIRKLGLEVQVISLYLYSLLFADHFAMDLFRCLLFKAEDADKNEYQKNC